jgi:hypothetical protein
MENEFVPYDIALAMEELGWGKENTMYYAVRMGKRKYNVLRLQQSN